MLQWSLSVLSKNSDLNIVIKPHPILSVDSIIDRYSKNIKDRIIISQENVNKLLEKSESIWFYLNHFHDFTKSAHLD